VLVRDNSFDNFDNFIDIKNLNGDGRGNNGLKDFFNDLIGLFFDNDFFKGFLDTRFHDDLITDWLDHFEDILGDIDLDIDLSRLVSGMMAGILASWHAGHGLAATVAVFG